MFASGKPNFVKRLLLCCNNASFLRTHILKVTFQYLAIVLVITGLHQIGLHRVRKESIEDLLRAILFYLLGDASFDLKPRLFEQAWPHVDAFDGLREQGSAIAADDIIIDIDELLLGANVHPEGMDAVCVGLRQ
jgi:hypothetical protein